MLAKGRRRWGTKEEEMEGEDEEGKMGEEMGKEEGGGSGTRDRRMGGEIGKEGGEMRKAGGRDGEGGGWRRRGKMGKEWEEVGKEEGEGWMGWRKRGSRDSYTHTTDYK